MGLGFAKMMKRGSPLADLSLIHRLEASHAVRLPAAYVELVKANDGGYFTPSELRVFDPTVGRETEQSCDALLSFANGEIGAVNDGSVDGLPRDVIAFGRDGGGWLFGFDYRADRATDDPPIVLYVPEYDDEHAILPVAQSFATFLDRLESFGP